MTSDKAWENYLRTLAEVRREAMNGMWGRTPQNRAQAQYYISMSEQYAFQLHMAPRQAFPSFLTSQFHTPAEIGWGAPCPDFRYHWTAIDGAHTYRLRGTRGNTNWVNIQAQRGWAGNAGWGEDMDRITIGQWDLDDFAIADDGTFEITLSPDRCEGNWIELDRDCGNITLLIRDIWDDWENDEGASFDIDRISPADGARLFLTEGEISDRLDAMAGMMRYSIAFFGGLAEQVHQRTGWNQFVELFAPPKQEGDAPAKHTSAGGAAAARYIQCVYDLEPGSALVIEVNCPPDARYWSLQMADFYHQTTDYKYHQTSLNRNQARPDADGKTRLVMSTEDPGVPNWISTAGLQQGLAMWRYYLVPDGELPRATLVKLSELRDHLPSDTPVVSAAERAASLATRRKQIERRFRTYPNLWA